MKKRTAILVIWIALSLPLSADQAIESVQQTLKDQGFYYGDITGEKNADTTAAIRRYQIRNGLQVTGELNDETLRSIKSSSSASAHAATAPSPPAVAELRSPAPDTSDLRDDAQRPDNSTNPRDAQPFVGGSYDQGPRGPIAGQVVPSGGALFAGTPYESAPLEIQRKVIADAQRLLARRGLFKDEIDGAYGPALEFSLRAYQARVGLKPSGRLDLETLAALELLPGAHTPVFTGRRPGMPPEPVVRGEWVRP